MQQFPRHHRRNTGIAALLPMASVWLAVVSGACTGSIGTGAGGNHEPGTGGTGEDGNGGGGNSAGGNSAEGGSDGNPAVPADCGARTLGVQPLRRLSATQYRNTIRDLFGEALAAPLLKDSPFPQTLYTVGFENDAEANNVSTLVSNAIEDNGERIAKTILAGPDPYLRALTTCNLPTAITDAAIDGCIDSFIRDFGLRAFRRKVTAEETTSIKSLYAALRAEQDARAAWVTVVQFFVESPGLLYRIERGAGPAPVAGLLKLTDHEMASRLSYFLTNSMPDQELFTEAAAGRLSTPAQVRAQAQRLMETPGFWDTVNSFHRDWLQVGPLAVATRDAKRFPGFTPAVQSALLEETGRLVRHVLEDGDGRLESLLSTANRPVNGPLATFYGASAPGASATAWVNAEMDNRRGVLNGGALMAATSHPDKTSPIHRGAFFQREILCNSIPDLPADVDTQGPLQDTSGLPTARQRLAPLLTNSQCRSCHTFINPIGFGFENYDAAGHWRDQENGTAIDASGTVDVDGESHDFATPGALAGLIAGGAQTRDCYALHLYRFAVGHREFAEDACSLAALAQAAAKGEGDIRAMLLELTQTDGFLFQKEPQR